MLAAPRAASASPSEREHSPDRRQSFVSASRTVVTRALTQASDFTEVLNAPARARTVHFAVHHLPRRPLAGGKAVPSLDAADLSTALTPMVSRSVNGPSLTGLWLGLVVPKRYAKRAVTRTLLKRRIRAAVSTSSATLAPGLWVVRLRTPFARSEFISAGSERLDKAAAGELAMLMAAAVARSPR